MMMMMTSTTMDVNTIITDITRSRHRDWFGVTIVGDIMRSLL